MCRSAIIRKKPSIILCLLIIQTLFAAKREQCSREWLVWFGSSFRVNNGYFLGYIRMYTKRVTRLLLPWRPCLDSKLWTKSRSDIKRAFGKQIISRPERCCSCFLKNNVNIKGWQRVGEIEKRREKCECKTFFVHEGIIWSFP